MKRFLLGLLLALASLSATADAVAVSGTDSVTVRDAACPADLVALAVSRGAPPSAPFRLAEAQVEGKTYKACWFPYRDQVAVIYEDGDTGMIPLSEFKPTKGT